MQRTYVDFELLWLFHAVMVNNTPLQKNPKKKKTVASPCLVPMFNRLLLELAKTDQTQLPTRIEHEFKWIWVEVFNMLH